MIRSNAEQQRATFALAEIQAVANKLNSEKNDKNRREWLSRAVELPAMIQMNGLGQTVAFYRSKAAQGSNAHHKLIDILQKWLCQENQPYSKQEDIIEAITGGDMHQYRAAQAEAQALLIWIKKFSRIYIKDETASGGEQ